MNANGEELLFQWALPMPSHERAVWLEVTPHRGVKTRPAGKRGKRLELATPDEFR